MVENTINCLEKDENDTDHSSRVRSFTIPDSEILNKYSDFINITDLNWSDNALVEIPPKIQDLINLKSLNLSKNKLSTLPLFLRKLYQLHSLYAAFNNFNEVPEVLFLGLRNLQVLDLSFNKIKIFNDIPSCLTNISNLKISNNTLTEVPSWIFNSLCNLKALELSNNPICKYGDPKTAFYASGIFESLIMLKIENSNFKSDYSEFIAYFSNLKFLYIGNSSQSENNANNFRNAKDDFTKNWNKNVIFLSLKNVQISLLSTDFFTCLTCLSHLDLSENKLSWLPEKISNLISLEVINLNFNELLFLPCGIGNLKNLKQIHLSNNQLSKLPDSFSNLHNLEILDLYHNKLDTFEFSILKLKNLKGVDLELNFLDFLFKNDELLVKKKYDSSKDWFRHLFGYNNIRCDEQKTKQVDNNKLSHDKSPYSDHEDIEEYDSDFYGNDSMSIQSVLPFEEMKNLSTDIEEVWEHEVLHMEKDDSFDPQIDHWSMPAFQEKEVYQKQNFCPGQSHLPPLNFQNWKNNKAEMDIEDGQFDSE